MRKVPSSAVAEQAVAKKAPGSRRSLHFPRQDLFKAKAWARRFTLLSR
jgi:hypothetical protein